MIVWELRITIAQHVYYVQMLLAMEKVFTDLTQVFSSFDHICSLQDQQFDLVFKLRTAKRRKKTKYGGKFLTVIYALSSIVGMYWYFHLLRMFQIPSF